MTFVFWFISAVDWMDHLIKTSFSNNVSYWTTSSVWLGFLNSLFEPFVQNRWNWEADFQRPWVEVQMQLSQPPPCWPDTLA